MTPQSASGAGVLGGEEVLPEHDEICSDEDNDITHDSECPSVSKVAVRRGSKHIFAHLNSSELIETISAIDATDAKSVHLDQREYSQLFKVLICSLLDQMRPP